MENIESFFGLQFLVEVKSFRSPSAGSEVGIQIYQKYLTTSGEKRLFRDDQKKSKELERVLADLAAIIKSEPDKLSPSFFDPLVKLLLGSYHLNSLSTFFLPSERPPSVGLARANSSANSATNVFSPRFIESLPDLPSIPVPEVTQDRDAPERSSTSPQRTSGKRPDKHNVSHGSSSAISKADLRNSGNDIPIPTMTTSTSTNSLAAPNATTGPTGSDASPRDPTATPSQPPTRTHSPSLVPARLSGKKDSEILSREALSARDNANNAASHSNTASATGGEAEPSAPQTSVSAKRKTTFLSSMTSASSPASGSLSKGLLKSKDKRPVSTGLPGGLFAGKISSSNQQHNAASQSASTSMPAMTLKLQCENICETCETNNMGTLKSLLLTWSDQVATLLTTYNMQGFTALYIAAKMGNFNFVTELLRSHKVHSVGIDQQMEPNRETALHVASAQGHEDICVLLLLYGADATVKEVNGKTASELAANPEVSRVFELFANERYAGLKRAYPKYEFLYKALALDPLSATSAGSTRVLQKQKQKALPSKLPLTLTGSGNLLMQTYNGSSQQQQQQQECNEASTPLVLNNKLSGREAPVPGTYSRIMKLTIMGSEANAAYAHSLLDNAEFVIIADTLVKIDVVTEEMGFYLKYLLANPGLVIYINLSNSKHLKCIRDCDEMVRKSFILLDATSDSAMNRRIMKPLPRSAMRHRSENPGHRDHGIEMKGDTLGALMIGERNEKGSSTKSSHNQSHGTVGFNAVRGKSHLCLAQIKFDRSQNFDVRKDLVRGTIERILNSNQTTIGGTSRMKLPPELPKIVNNLVHCRADPCVPKVLSYERLNEFFMQSLCDGEADKHGQELLLSSDLPGEDSPTMNFFLFYSDGSVAKKSIFREEVNGFTVADLMRKKFRFTDQPLQEAIFLDKAYQHVSLDTPINRLPENIIRYLHGFDSAKIVSILEKSGWIFPIEGTNSYLLDQNFFMQFVNTTFLANEQLVNSPLFLTQEKLLEICGSSGEDPKLMLRALESYEFVYPDRISAKYMVPVLSLLQPKKRPLLIDFYNVKREAHVNRFFVLTKGFTFTIMQRMSSLLYSAFHATYSLSSWIENYSTILFIKVSNESTAVIKFENAIIMIEYAGARNECYVFAKLCEFVRSELRVLHCHIDFDEMIQCKCGNHTYFLEDLLEGMLQGKRHVHCHHMPKSILLEHLVPDILLPHIRSYHDKYTELETLGEGAFGRVTRAEMKETGLVVAVKHFLHTSAAALVGGHSAHQAVQRGGSGSEEASLNWASYSSFQYEAELASNLDNKHLIRQLGIDIKELALVMEFAPHGVLGNLLYKRQPASGLSSSGTVTNSSDASDSLQSLPRSTLLPLSLQLRKKFCRDIVAGLAYMHSLKPPVVHRDLRSFNIFVMSLDESADVCVKIGDFGLSAVVHARLTEALESWQWCAPEVIAGKPYDESSDIYSFGIIIYEIFSRCMPFSNIDSLLVQKEVQLTENQVDTPEKLQELERKGIEYLGGTKGILREVKTIQAKDQICNHGLRPNIAHFGPNLTDFLRSCWHENPSQRLNAQMAQNQITVILSDDEEINNDLLNHSAMNNVLISGSNFRQLRKVNSMRNHQLKRTNSRDLQSLEKVYQSIKEIQKTGSQEDLMKKQAELELGLLVDTSASALSCGTTSESTSTTTASSTTMPARLSLSTPTSPNASPPVSMHNSASNVPTTTGTGHTSIASTSTTLASSTSSGAISPASTTVSSPNSSRRKSSGDGAKGGSASVNTRRKSSGDGSKSNRSISGHSTSPGREVSALLFANSGGSESTESVPTAVSAENTINHALELVNLFTNVNATEATADGSATPTTASSASSTSSTTAPIPVAGDAQESKSDPALLTHSRGASSSKWNKTDRIGGGRYSASSSSVPVMQRTSRSMNRKATELTGAENPNNNAATTTTSNTTSTTSTTEKEKGADGPPTK